MSSFKGDQRYRSHVDDAPYDSPSSEEHEEELVTPPVKYFHTFVEEWYEEIERMYTAYVDTGREVFGGAFFQLGTIADFAAHIWQFTQPGELRTLSRRPGKSTNEPLDRWTWSSSTLPIQ